MKPVRIIFLYSPKQPEQTRRNVKYFQTNLSVILKTNKVRPVFEVKQNSVSGINMRFKDLDAGKEIILENMEEIQQYFGIGQKQKKDVDSNDPNSITEEYTNYMLNIADEGDDDIKDDKDEKFKNRANEIKMVSERKKNEFKNQVGGKRNTTVGKRVSIGKPPGGPSSHTDSSDIPSTVTRRPQSSSQSSRRAPIDDNSRDDFLIRDKIAQSNGGTSL